MDVSDYSFKHFRLPDITEVRGFVTTATAYLQAYRRRAARVRVRQIDGHPAAAAGGPPVSVGPLATLGARRQDLDVAAILKASQTISSEIVLETLIESLMATLLVQAGAERGVLLLHQGGEVTVAAHAETMGKPMGETIGETTGKTIRVDLGASPRAFDFPRSLIHTVLRTRESVVIEDARRQHDFATDDYFSQYQPRAVLCLALVKQSDTIGILFVENTLSPGTVTPTSLMVLETLAAQAAVSLENARLYRQLTEENQAHLKAIEALRKSELALSATQRLNKTGKWRWEPQADILEWSDETYEMLQLDKSTVSPSYQMFLERIHPDDREAVNRKTTAAAAEQRELYQDYRIILEDGSINYLQAIGIPHFYEGDRWEYIGIVIDITDRRRAEEALRVSQSETARISHLTTVGQLTASIAHEVNQPLAAITTNAEASLRWLDRSPPDIGEARNAATRVLRDVKRAVDVIKGVRALVRQGSAEVVEIDVGDLLAEIQSLISPDLRRGDAVLSLVLPEYPVIVRGDRVQLQQVLLNLVRNAIEAMAVVEQRLRIVVVRVHAEARDTIEIRIEDTGPGIDPAVGDRLFEPMVTTKSEGMGMGLSICRSIVEAHGGRLWAQARPLQGTVFGFTLLRVGPPAPHEQP